MLSYKSYIAKCLIGIEVAYFICLIGGYMAIGRTAAGVQLHHALFETLPGFVWGSFGSVILGAVYMFIFALIFGTYMVWMHNSSLKSN